MSTPSSEKPAPSVCSSCDAPWRSESHVYGQTKCCPECDHTEPSEVTTYWVIQYQNGTSDLGWMDWTDPLHSEAEVLDQLSELRLDARPSARFRVLCVATTVSHLGGGDL